MMVAVAASRLKFAASRLKFGGITCLMSAQARFGREQVLSEIAAS